MNFAEMSTDELLAREAEIFGEIREGLPELREEDRAEMLKKISGKLAELRAGNGAEETGGEGAEGTGAETRDGAPMTNDELESRIEELEAIEAELEARKQAHAEEERQMREMADKPGKKIDTEGKAMEKKYTRESPEYRSGLLKDLLGQELTAEERDAVNFVATTTDQTYGSGNVLPREMLNQIWDLIDDQHSILGDIDLYRTGTILEIAKRTEISQGDAAEVDEATANDDEINTFTKVTLTGKDFSKHVDISYAMAQMSIDAFEAFLISEIADRIGAALAADVVAQIANDYDSTNNAITTEGVKVVAFTEVANVMATLKNAKGQAVVYANRASIYKYLVGMVDDNGRPIFQVNAQNGAEGTLIGCPVKVEDAVGDNIFYIGYPKQVVGNMIQDVMVESDRDIKRHVITYAGYARFECKLMAPKAFAKLTVKQSL